MFYPPLEKGEAATSLIRNNEKALFKILYAIFAKRFDATGILKHSAILEPQNPPIDKLRYSDFVAAKL